jgi:hypothetical protein
VEQVLNGFNQFVSISLSGLYVADESQIYLDAAGFGH